MKGLGRESVVRRDVRKGVKSEVGGIGGQRWNWVSQTSTPPLQGSGILTLQKVELSGMG